MSDYSVVAYSPEALLSQFSELAGARKDDVDMKLHGIYFPEYFKHLEAKTIVVEHDYVDRDYLEDFAGYYVRCFKPPKSRCSRLHFFNSSFDEKAFTSFLEGQGREEFLRDKLNDETYIGFIVVKPLPQTFVGRTCLRTYEDDSSGRSFPAVKHYAVNLFGVQLSINTLAYQEQDTEVARCATAALWTVLQATGNRFGHAVPTPVEITKYAVAIHANRSRTLPAKDGLTMDQLSDAIRKMNLEPYCITSLSQDALQAESYAYLRAGIPSLLLMSLVDTRDKDGLDLSTGKLLGFHAVAITGYCIKDRPPIPIGPQSGLILRATRIEKLYAHDDQIGPFARMTLSAPDRQMKWLDTRGKEQDTTFLDCSWRGASGIVGSVRAIPQNLIIPLYPKMRILFQDALRATTTFDSVLRKLAEFSLVDLPQNLEWDIFLTTAGELKRDLIDAGLISGFDGRAILTASMPRFIWRSVGYLDGKPCVELLFDATDITQGTFFIRAIEYDKRFADGLRRPNVDSLATSRESRTILEWFFNHPLS